jgi:hypothetical protein
LIVVLRCNKAGASMLNLETEDRTANDWRAPAAAWLLPILLAALFGTAHAAASRHHAAPRACALAGAAIPHHDASLLGPDEIKASDRLERVRADASSGM